MSEVFILLNRYPIPRRKSTKTIFLNVHNTYYASSYIPVSCKIKQTT